MPDHLPRPEIEDLTREQSESNKAQDGRREVAAWIVIPAMVLGLVLAALILSRVAGPLYDLLFPDPLPVPGGSEEVEHVKPDKGAEYWVYRTSKTGSEVARYFEKQGGTCRYTASAAPGSVPETENPGEHSVARCMGKGEGGASGFSWEVYIAEGYTPDVGPTLFRIYKFG